VSGSSTIHSNHTHSHIQIHLMREERERRISSPKEQRSQQTHPSPHASCSGRWLPRGGRGPRQATPARPLEGSGNPHAGAARWAVRPRRGAPPRMAAEPPPLEAETRERTEEMERERTRRSDDATMALLPRPRSRRRNGGRADAAREPAPALRRGTRRWR
jgi:hypothetical protein